MPISSASVSKGVNFCTEVPLLHWCGICPQVSAVLEDLEQETTIRRVWWAQGSRQHRTQARWDIRRCSSPPAQCLCPRQPRASACSTQRPTSDTSRAWPQNLLPSASGTKLSQVHLDTDDGVCMYRWLQLKLAMWSYYRGKASILFSKSNDEDPVG